MAAARSSLEDDAWLLNVEGNEVVIIVLIVIKINMVTEREECRLRLGARLKKIWQKWKLLGMTPKIVVDGKSAA